MAEYRSPALDAIKTRNKRKQMETAECRGSPQISPSSCSRRREKYKNCNLKFHMKIDYPTKERAFFKWSRSNKFVICCCSRGIDMVKNTDDDTSYFLASVSSKYLPNHSEENKLLEVPLTYQWYPWINIANLISYLLSDILRQYLDQLMVENDTIKCLGQSNTSISDGAIGFMFLRIFVIAKDNILSCKEWKGSTISRPNFLTN